MMLPQFQNMFNYDELWNGIIYESGDEPKNLITSLNHQEMQGLTSLRMKITNFLIEICS